MNRNVYVVKRNVVVPCFNSTRSEKKTLRLGSVMKGRSTSQRNSIILTYANETTDGSDEEFVVNVEDLKHVPSELCQALLSVASPFDRINIAMDSLLCSDLAEIKVNDTVLYLDELTNKWVKCNIKAIGPNPKYGEGHYYSIQSLENFGSPIIHTSVEKLRPFNGKKYYIEYSGAVKYSEVFCNVRKSVIKVEDLEPTPLPIHVNSCYISEVNSKREETENSQKFPHSASNKRDFISKNTCEKAPNVIKDTHLHCVKQYENKNEVKQGKCKTSLNIELINDFAAVWPQIPDIITPLKGQEDCRLTFKDSAMPGMEQMDSSPVEGVIRPINWKNDLEKMCGKFRGIQGHHNSCYLDATLFSMFTFTSVFDDLLYRPKSGDDIDQYEEVQRVLRDNIVNPLRKNKFVQADKVMILRKLLDDLSSVSGLTSEEKDPEEFLNSLVAQILKAKPFLKLNSGQEAYHYQLFVEKDENLKLPSVQQLFDQSFLASDIKLKKVPPVLIIQMPRFGKSYKMYPRIIPSQLLDITDVIAYSPRQCIVCGKLAELECRECFDQFGTGLESTAFCSVCIQTAHSHIIRNSHTTRRLQVTEEYSRHTSGGHIPRIYMELFAVMCIETSHYVTFAKCGSGSDAPWCFFNSMADRKGEQDGFNIPEVVSCKMLPYWLSDEGANSLLDIDDDRLLPEHAKRLLCDAYMCMYRSPDVQMYR